MLLKHWVIRDDVNRKVHIQFQDPSLNHFNIFTRVADKQTLQYLRDVDMPGGWKFQAKYINIEVNNNGRLDLRMKRYLTCTEYYPVEFFQQLIGEYLEELEKMED